MVHMIPASSGVSGFSSSSTLLPSEDADDASELERESSLLLVSDAPESNQAAAGNAPSGRVESGATLLTGLNSVSSTGPTFSALIKA